jgi:putative spermidine/putrescine transport system ATP-binding protein
MLRPEHLRVADSTHGEPGPGGQGFNHLQARLSAVVYQGDSCLLQATLEGGAAISVRCPASGAAGGAFLAPGASLTLAILPEHTVVLPA